MGGWKASLDTTRFATLALSPSTFCAWRRAAQPRSYELRHAQSTSDSRNQGDAQSKAKQKPSRLARSVPRIRWWVGGPAYRGTLARGGAMPALTQHSLCPSPDAEVGCDSRGIRVRTAVHLAGTTLRAVSRLNCRASANAERLRRGNCAPWGESSSAWLGSQRDDNETAQFHVSGARECERACADREIDEPLAFLFDAGLALRRGHCQHEEERAGAGGGG